MTQLVESGTPTPSPIRLISIVTPVWNEEVNVEVCHEAVRDLFNGPLAAYDYEHIFCDNASTDRTVPILRDIASKDPHVRVILNSRNFGPFRSLFNGMLATRGDGVVPFLAVDLQDPPELIPDFVRLWQQGYDVVYGTRANREETLALRISRRIYYRLVRWMADIDIPEDTGEFQLLDRRVVDSLRNFDDYYPYLRGMIASCGFRRVGVSYTWRSRKRGFSKNRLPMLADQALNGLISFSNVPMRLCMLVGFGIAIPSILYAIFAFVINLIYFRKIAAPGIPTLICALFLFGGLQFIFLGILGEYISAIHYQVRKRPLVIERERINFT